MIDLLFPGGVRAIATRKLSFPPDLGLIARELDEPGRACVHFDSAEHHPELGRFSYLCPRSVWEVVAQRDKIVIRTKDGDREVGADGVAVLEQLLGDVARYGAHDAPAPFAGGLVGFLAYELHELFEPKSVRQPRGGALPDFVLARVDWLVVVDEASQDAWLIANGFGDSRSMAHDRAQIVCEEAWMLIRSHLRVRESRASTAPNGRPIEPREVDMVALTTRDCYLERVRAIQSAIRAGDVYEVCLSQRYERNGGFDPHDLHEALRTENAAPMSALMRMGGVDIVSASFERFLRIDSDRTVETRPVKGTRPRGSGRRSDDQLRSELHASHKDRAENVMAVDVARNDLGRVCDYGSVEVVSLCAVESYRVTHQLVSTVRGRLYKDKGTFDAIKAAFPGASMTGAPKIQAMLTIAENEPVARGVFAGALLWAGFDGQIDSSIVIRTFVQHSHGLGLHVGGAVIADSVPEAEYDETLDKAQGMFRALVDVETGVK